MIGVNAYTGKHLSGVEHLRQSIRDILCTRVGTRVMRRDYGSELPALVDAPLNGDTLLDIYAATVTALAKWEPRIEVTKVEAQAAGEDGQVVLTLEGIYRPDGRSITLPGILV